MAERGSATPPAGWYPDPEGGSRPRWWTGTSWAMTAAPRPRRSRWLVPGLVGGGVLLLALLVSVSGGVGGFVSTVGLSAIVIGVVGLARNGVAALALRNRLMAGIALGAGIFVVLVGGSVAGASIDPVESSDRRGFAGVAESSTPEASGGSTPEPVVEVREEITTHAIPFVAVTVDDPSRDVGTSAVTVVGVDGVRTVTSEVTYTDGVETARRQVSDVVTTPPVDQVTAVGTRAPRAAPPSSTGGGAGCDPNYSGCVPIDSDVDCAGGSGNGPSYARGPVTVVGSDVYDLDSDGDGVACE